MTEDQTRAKRREFEATLEPMGPGGAWTCLRLPFSAQEAFGSKARIAVKGTINGTAFRSSVFPSGAGSHFMMVNKSMQKGAEVKAGDIVELVLEIDLAPRTLDVPEDLVEALAHHDGARERFGKMSYSHQKEYVDWIESAKPEDTRVRRVEKALKMLSAGTRLKG